MGSVSIRVSFPLSGVEMNAAGLTVRMSEYAHDIAIVTFGARLSTPAVTGAPVYIAWGDPTRPTAFFGYFDHAVADTTKTSIVCVGASYLMKHARQNVWTDLSADALAYEVADRYQLDADIAVHDRMFEQIVQTAESDWQLLCRVAKSVGYTCYVHQTQLAFYPRSRDFVGIQDVAPLFAGSDILAFSPTVGNAIPDAEANAARQLLGVDSAGELVAAADAGPGPTAGSVGYTPTFRAIDQTVVNSVSDALATLVAQREANRWYITADAVVRGDPSLRQAMPVYLGNLTAEHTGYWFVLCAEHRVMPTGGGYTVALKLGRDGTGQSIRTPSDPYGGVLGIDPVTGVEDISSPRLVNGLWQASRSVAYTPVEEPMPDFVRDRLSGVA